MKFDMWEYFYTSQDFFEFVLTTRNLGIAATTKQAFPSKSAKTILIKCILQNSIELA